MKKSSIKFIVAPIICTGTLAIVLVMLLFLSALTGIVFLIGSEREDGEEDAGISIDSLGTMNVRPLDLLTITGSGFEPDNSAISVVFMDRVGFPMTVPATYADGDTVEVVVPPLINGTTFSDGKFSVRVVQVSKDKVRTSNVLDDLEVGPMLDLRGSMRTGYLTILFLDACLDCVNSTLMNETDPEMVSVMSDYRSSMMDLKYQVAFLVKGYIGSLNLSTIEGGTVELNTVLVRDLDRLLLNMVDRLLNAFPSNITRSEPTRASIDEDEEYRRKVTEDVEQFRATAMKQHEIGAMLLEPAARFCFGLYSTVTGLVGGAALGIGLAAQVAIAVGSSWLTQLASGEIPTPSGTMQTAMETVTDSKIGFPVIGLLKDPLLLMKKMDQGLEEAKRFRHGEPSGGVMVNDRKNLRPPFDEQRTLFKKAPGSLTRKLDIPVDQGSISFKEALPSVPAGMVTYSGTFDGSATFPRTTNCPYCGTVVSHFDYTVIVTATLSGNVDRDGRLSGTFRASGDWSVTGTGGCGHIVCQPSNGPISLVQSISGSTSGFSLSKGGDLVQGMTGTMDPDSVYGEMVFLTTDGSFTVRYTLTPD